MQLHINITPDEQGINWVSGRGLYGYMDNQRDEFIGWIRHRIKMLKFTSGVDYKEVKGWREHPKAKAVIEILLTVDAAKALSEYARSGDALDYLKQWEAQQIQGVTTTDALSAHSAFPANWKRVEPRQTGVEYPALKSTHAFSQVPGEGDSLTVSDYAAPLVTQGQKPAATGLTQLLKQAQELAEQGTLDDDYKSSVAGSFQAHEARLDSLESQMSCLIGIFQHASQLLFGGPVELGLGLDEHPMIPLEEVVDETLPPIPTDQPVPVRAKLVRLVNDYAREHNRPFRVIWSHLYDRLNAHYGFNVSQHRSSAKEYYLDAVERHGWLDKLYELAKGELSPKPQQVA